MDSFSYIGKWYKNNYARQWSDERVDWNISECGKTLNLLNIYHFALNTNIHPDFIF